MLPDGYEGSSHVLRHLSQSLERVEQLVVLHRWSPHLGVCRQGNSEGAGFRARVFVGDPCRRSDQRGELLAFGHSVPRIGERIAGPFPAENTPLRSGETPNQSLAPERSVARPTPGGSVAIHQARRRPSAFWKVTTGSF